MAALDVFFVLVGTVAAFIGIYFLSKTATPLAPLFTKGVLRVFVVASSSIGLGLFVAYRLLGILPAWPFHLAFASTMSALATGAYLKHKHDRVI
jgi:hypothetical protein